MAGSDGSHLAEGILESFRVIGERPNHQVGVRTESGHVIPAAHHDALHGFFQTADNAFEALRVGRQGSGPTEHHVQRIVISGIDFAIIYRVVAGVAGDFRSSLNRLGMSHNVSFASGLVIGVMKMRVGRARILATIWSASFCQRRVGIGFHGL